ncbi:MAG: AAA family ATPase [Oscillospiraceae bacterium]|nr:AAA family ATPase [Oscillospiraceae bacterium]
MYISKEIVQLAAQRISIVHPFFGITFLSSKKNTLPVGTKKNCSIDTWNKHYLDEYHKINPESAFYFQPFNSNARDKQWVNDRYPSTGLQAVNTQTFRDAFLHERGERSWGWAENYVSILSKWLRKYSQKMPAFYLAVWTQRNRIWHDAITADGILNAFYNEFHIVEAEKTQLFDTTIPAEISGIVLSQNNPITWVDFSEHVTLPPDLAEKLAAEREAAERALSKAPSRYWLYSAGDNSVCWEEFYADGIMAIGWDELGDLAVFASKEQMKSAMKRVYGEEYSYKNSALATWQFANEIRPGDIVFVKKGRNRIIGRGIVESDYTFDNERSIYKNIRKVCWTHKGEWDHPGQAVIKALTDITAYTDYVSKLESLLLNEELPELEKESLDVQYPPYKKEDFLNEVFMTSERYDTITRLLTYHKNLILQGAPGVGKTFAAKRLAYSIIGSQDKSRVMVVQFHQSYSYEDFVLGYRPSQTGFELIPGPFYQFCKEAKDDDENAYFFIIDEINRGNMSKIFGELLMLIERDKRGEQLRLLYSNELFEVPANVHIIGMMNTADRSLALIDYALRRRFAFCELVPAFDSDGFSKVMTIANNTKFNSLVQCIKDLNVAIQKDDALGKGFCIGHSYLCVNDAVTDDWVTDVIDYEIVPLLEEYWFDDIDKRDYWISKLHEAVK